MLRIKALISDFSLNDSTFYKKTGKDMCFFVLLHSKNLQNDNG